MSEGELQFDMLEKILLKVEDPADLARLSLVSKCWYKHIFSNFFWKMQPASSSKVCCFSDEDHLFSSPISSHEELRLQKLSASGLDSKVVSHHSFSCGLLCLCFKHNKIYEIHVYDPFKLHTPRHILSPMDVLQPQESICSLCFNADSLSENYNLILAVSLQEKYSIVFYNWSTDTWSRSRSFDGNFSIDFGVGKDEISMCYVQNSLCFLEDSSEPPNRYGIARYHIPTQTWSKRWFDETHLLGHQEDFDWLSLTQSKGELMLVAVVINENHIYVWHVRAHNSSNCVFELSSKIVLGPETTYDSISVKHEHDLICIGLLQDWEVICDLAKEEVLEDWEFTHQILIYSPSNKRWQHVLVPSRKPGCYFLTETERIFAD